MKLETYEHIIAHIYKLDVDLESGTVRNKKNCKEV